MEKYNKILDLFQELIEEINSLSDYEFEQLKLALEYSIWQDKVRNLRKED